MTATFAVDEAEKESGTAQNRNSCAFFCFESSLLTVLCISSLLIVFCPPVGLAVAALCLVVLSGYYLACGEGESAKSSPEDSEYNNAPLELLTAF